MTFSVDAKLHFLTIEEGVRAAPKRCRCGTHLRCANCADLRSNLSFCLPSLEAPLRVNGSLFRRHVRRAANLLLSIHVIFVVALLARLAYLILLSHAEPLHVVSFAYGGETGHIAAS